MKTDGIRRVTGFLLCWLFLIMQLLAPVLPARAETTETEFDQELYATGAVLLDGRSGRVLYGKNADVPMAMASTTKIMTCILVLENCNLDETLTVSSYAAGMPKVKLYLNRGEEYRVGDLLYSLMLESHNDSAVALAEHVGRNYLENGPGEKKAAEYTLEESKEAVAAFAGLMNRKARKLGCRDTYFITPNGLDAAETITMEDGSTVQKEHMTTARDLAVIMSYCIDKSEKSREFLQITGTRSYSFSANGRSFCCNNHNAFLDMMEGVISGKTGFTNKAGYCYVGAMEREGRVFIVALLACGWPNNKSYKWSDTKKLMEYGATHYRWQDLSDSALLYDEELPDIPVAEGQTRYIGQQARVAVKIPEREEAGKEADKAEKKEGEKGIENGAGKEGEKGTENGAGKGTEKGTGKEESKGTDKEAGREEERGTEKETGKEEGAVQEEPEGMLLREDERVQVKCYLTRQLQAPVEAGKTVGKIEYSLGDQVFKTETIVTAEAVDRIDLQWCWKQIFRQFTGL